MNKHVFLIIEKLMQLCRFGCVGCNIKKTHKYLCINHRSVSVWNDKSRSICIYVPRVMQENATQHTLNNKPITKEYKTH